MEFKYCLSFVFDHPFPPVAESHIGILGTVVMDVKGFLSKCER